MACGAAAGWLTPLAAFAFAAGCRAPLLVAASAAAMLLVVTMLFEEQQSKYCFHNLMQ